MVPKSKPDFSAVMYSPPSNKFLQLMNGFPPTKPSINLQSNNEKFSMGTKLGKNYGNKSTNNFTKFQHGPKNYGHPKPPFQQKFHQKFKGKINGHPSSPLPSKSIDINTYHQIMGHLSEDI
jgi:hypothetical protein